MALFGGNKKQCPICGNPAGRLLPTKVEGQPLCSECAGKADALPANVRNTYLSSLGSFRSYLADYEANQALRETYQESYQSQFGLLGGTLSLDTSHRLLQLNASKNGFVLESSNIRRFRILEDGSPLFEGTKDALICYQSTVPDRVRNMGPDISRLERDQMHYEELQRMEETMEKQANERGETYTRRYIPEPNINELRPFQKFYVVIEVNHPYSESSTEFKKDAPYFSGPGFFGGYSSAISDYQRDYEAAVSEMRELATQLMAVLNPNAPERQAGSGAMSGMQAPPITPVSTTDTAAEIQKFKALFDSGAITEEEYNAKKQQLLGM